jgi:L-alanine-DL-glutamate epimerase-like enolase superfamily enzyme
MPKLTDITLRDVRVEQELLKYRAPIKFGGRVVTDAVLVNVTLAVETVAGKRASGFGSMPMGNVWAWPSAKVTVEQSLQAMLRFIELLTASVQQNPTTAHPLDITHSWHPLYKQAAAKVQSELNLAEPMPPLAILVAASPFEAAIHDAFGKVHAQNAYNLLGKEWVEHDLAHYLTPDFAGEYLDQYTSRQPKPTMPLYHLVGALDPLFDADIANRLNDGLPETLGEWITHDGLTHLKIKLNGDNLAWDVDRVVAVERAAVPAQQSRGCGAWNYSLDFNEKCANVEYLLEFLKLVEERSPAALGRVQYIEQPTHRDLKLHPENRMHRAAAIKPVVIDESLIDLESLHLAREQGYSGVALKACKGHTEALLMGAAAQKYGLFLCVQDLSCPGYSFLHSASLAARIPTIVAIEGNSRQYCPVGNRGWNERFPGMFRLNNGTVATSELNGNGLGF